MEGKVLSPYLVEIEGDALKLGVQLCRELKFPEQWRYLAIQGADLLIYVNNATGDPSEYEIWKSQLITRASENQRWVVSVNLASVMQKSPTCIISPSEEVKYEADQKPENMVFEIDLSKNSSWYIDQRANKVVDVVNKKRWANDYKWR